MIWLIIWPYFMYIETGLHFFTVDYGSKKDLLSSQLSNKTIMFLWSRRYLLQPKGNGSKSKSDDLGSLRLKLTYIEDTVLPSVCYTPLCNLLLKSPDVKVRQRLRY